MFRSAIAAVVAAGLVASACSGTANEGDPEAAQATGGGSAEPPDSTAAPEVPDSTDQTDVTNPTDATNPTDVTNPTDATGQTGIGTPVSMVPDPDVAPLAPPGGRQGAVMYWNRDIAGWFGHTDGWMPLAEGPLVAVAEVAGRAVVFQRSLDDHVIWLQTADGPQELLVAGEGDRLELEGAPVEIDAAPLVYYQRHVTGSPEDTVSTLRSYNLDTGEVREIVRTGGWESGTDFAHLTGGLAAGAWFAEATTGLMIVDLDDGTVVYDSDEAGLNCEDGEPTPTCPGYEQATIIDDTVYGVRSIWNQERQLVDAKGIFTFDWTTGTERMLVGFPWDNGEWYVEDMVAGWTGLTISLRDGDGDPLPALRLQVETGQVTTSPLAAFVRPAYLS